MAGGEGAAQPFHVSELEGQQDETDAVPHVHRALRVHKVMRRAVAHVLFEAARHRLVQPEQENRNWSDVAVRFLFFFCRLNCDSRDMGRERITDSVQMNGNTIKKVRFKKKKKKKEQEEA